MKVGVFHWAFDFIGGGEKVAFDIAEVFGRKEVYTLFSSATDPEGRGIKAVDISYLLPRWGRLFGKFTKRKRGFEYWLWEMIDVRELDNFDVIITSGVTPRAIIAPEDVVHVNYCHSVPRWLWDLWHFRWKNTKKSLFIFWSAELLRALDVVADTRVDYYVVNSELIQRRLWHYLKRDSVIIYPSIRTKKYYFKEFGDFILHIGRIDKEKQVFPVIKACEKLGTKLVLIGNKGNDRETYEYLQKNNGRVIDYRGVVSEEEKRELLATCKAVVYNPISEDFGIVPTEAFASGKPVIVNNTGFPPVLIRKGDFVKKDGAIEVRKTGMITNGTAEMIATAIKLLDSFEWNNKELIAFARSFDFEVFKQKMQDYVTDVQKQFSEMQHI
ncbi:MAG: glycosyltransferase [Candidatus Bathyarchaeia archaeon]